MKQQKTRCNLLLTKLLIATLFLAMVNCQKEDDANNTVNKEFKTNNPIIAHYISGDSLIK